MLDLFTDPLELLTAAVNKCQEKVVPRVYNQRAPNLDRGRVWGHERLMRDYFSNNATYNDGHFRRRFRISPSIFKRLVEILVKNNHYFKQVRSCHAVVCRAAQSYIVFPEARLYRSTGIIGRTEDHSCFACAGLRDCCRCSGRCCDLAGSLHNKSTCLIFALL